MTHTLELPENVERVLEQKARQRGVALDDYLLELAVQDADDEAQNAAQKEAARREAVRRARGLLKGNGHETEDFMRERRKETLREMEKDAQSMSQDIKCLA